MRAIKNQYINDIKTNNVQRYNIEETTEMVGTKKTFQCFSKSISSFPGCHCQSSVRDEAASTETAACLAESHP